MTLTRTATAPQRRTPRDRESALTSYFGGSGRGRGREVVDQLIKDPPQVIDDRNVLLFYSAALSFISLTLPPPSRPSNIPEGGVLVIPNTAPSQTGDTPMDTGGGRFLRFKPLTEQEKAALSQADAAKQQMADDPHFKWLLGMALGADGKGILESRTLRNLSLAWSKLDYTKDGVLTPEDFSSACGVAPVWAQLLHLCDIDGDGAISEREFVAGFLLWAMGKEITIQATGQTSAVLVLKSLQTVRSGGIVCFAFTARTYHFPSSAPPPAAY